MHRFPSFVALAAMALVAGVLIGQDKPATRPATQPGRSPEVIQRDLQRISSQLRDTIGEPDALFIPEKRKTLAPKALPLLKSMIPLLDELANAMPAERNDILQASTEYLAIAAALGDADSIARLDTLARAQGPQSMEARCAQQLAAWWSKPGDAAAQAKVLDEMQKLGKTDPKSETIAQTLIKMSQMGPANRDVADRAQKILADELTGELAIQAKCRRLMEDWKATTKNEAAQGKVLDEIQKLAKANPKSDVLADCVATMANSGAASDAMANRARKILTEDLSGESARESLLQLTCVQRVQEWDRASKDEAAQSKILDEMQKLAKANPKSEILAQAMGRMAQNNAATPALAERAQKILSDDLSSEASKMVSGDLAAQKKLREAVGKPVEIAGTTLDGQKFTTKDWKGSVVLVDFWATWCGPCIEELPRVKKAYLRWHAKGLEIVGVSCDASAPELQAFLGKNKDMPWPQLFDANENPKLQWHPLAKQWSINAIPTMFLIDRKGILRNVDAREKFDEEIPKLIEEKPE